MQSWRKQEFHLSGLWRESWEGVGVPGAPPGWEQIPEILLLLQSLQCFPLEHPKPSLWHKEKPLLAFVEDLCRAGSFSASLKAPCWSPPWKELLDCGNPCNVNFFSQFLLWQLAKHGFV